MKEVIASLAARSKDVRAHLRIRWSVFGKEEGYLSSIEPPVSMEFDGFDGLSTTRHFIVSIRKEDRR
ncbi:hypothetical protein [Sorangium sp. So ce1099]|uniref:hypothetical protein n=1 Tax=Sorangium sp. So ce1099 TaxID=3133331 RepID=UPI003F620C8E